MTRTHKDLPGGSQDWADEVDRLMAENKALTEVVKRLCQNAGLDFSNPGRGISAGDTPSIHNPVGQKLSSLADVQIYNVADKQVLTWNQSGQKWLPTTLPAPAGGGATFSVPIPIVRDLGYMGYGNLKTVTDPYAIYAFDTAGTTRVRASLFAEMSVDNGVYDTYGNAQVWSRVAAQKDYSYLASNSGITGKYSSAEVYPDRIVLQSSGWVHLNGMYVILPQGSSRPNPVDVGTGALFYDLNIHKPIFSDGAIWRDALGTAV